MKKLVKLNLARNCLKYIIKSYGIKTLHIPYYTCPVVWNSVREMNCEVKFYHIDDKFLPTIEFNKDDFILYTNYFGLCSENCKILSEKYKNIIIDNSQSFYSNPLGLASFNSIRKFFNVQNGAYLYIEKPLEEDFEVDNLELLPAMMHEDYETFVKNELTLNEEKKIKLISPKVEQELQKIDFAQDKKLRLDLFKKYAAKFDSENKIIFKPSTSEIPYCYPFSPKNIEIAENFIKQNLILLRLWQPLHKNFQEYDLLNTTIALPLNSYAEKILI